MSQGLGQVKANWARHWMGNLARTIRVLLAYASITADIAEGRLRTTWYCGSHERFVGGP